MDSGIYQHFRKDEAPFIDRMTELINTALTEYRPILTEFLDPRQIYIVNALMHSDEVSIHQFGGYPAAEKQRLIIAPDYFEPQTSDFNMTPILIKYPEKFAELKHGTILGTLVNQGIDRDVFGDIITDGTVWQFFVDTKILDFVLAQIDHIGRIKVRLEAIDFPNIIQPVVEWVAESLTVASYRLDTLVSDVFKVSRQRAKQIIEANQVKVNWQIVQKPDFEVRSLDMISVRHFGRVQILENQGETRKGKIRLETRTLRK
ncbi:RNA-binding protein [Agrilactobacillus yilanensis]|uniref:RNA-binding protein n=1 Tax=Agrilactobacillus yilanensis TaxID=2485997 RepID=A0ABW4J5C3_9LACO|nr:RNA-binding protein [Agrilactobacillus yilanensis]